MFELIYTGFFFILVIEVLLFLFLNLPTPKGWKGRTINFLSQNQSVRTLLKIHLGCCVLSALFFVDCMNRESKFQVDKDLAKLGDSFASELKYSYLSFMILKIQRDKYITFMLIYASLALNAYILILQYLYNKREKIQAQIQEQAKPAEQSSVRTSDVTPN